MTSHGTAAGPCGHWTGGVGYCHAPAGKAYLIGPRCPAHTPAAIAGRPEPAPDPARTMAGMREAWYAARGLPVPASLTPAGPTVIDDRAIASGKRRSSHAGYQAARARLEGDRA